MVTFVKMKSLTQSRGNQVYTHAWLSLSFPLSG